MDTWLHIISITSILLFTIFYTFVIILYPNVYSFIRFLAILIFVAAIVLIFNRNTYLPFLGKCAIPPSLLMNEKIPEGASKTHVLKLNDVDDGTRVIYWAALKSNDDKIKPPTEAYGDYSNAGIAIVKNKKTLLHFNCPDKYSVGSMVLNSHVHYRLMTPNDPILSSVYTIDVEC